MWKYHFGKALGNNFICSKTHKNINTFWCGKRKIIVLRTLYFIGFFLFMKKRFYVMYVQKEIMKNILVKATLKLDSLLYFYSIVGYLVFHFTTTKQPINVLQGLWGEGYFCTFLDATIFLKPKFFDETGIDADISCYQNKKYPHLGTKSARPLRGQWFG